jgi:hypothetical protein
MTESFDFSEVSIPVREAGPGRPAEPNPFIDKVAELVDADGTPRDVAVSFTLPDAADSQAADRVRRQLARAGVVHNVSVFKRVEDVPDGARVTFWAQSRIVPQRKPKDDAESNGSDDAAPETASVSAGVTVLEP